jgi:Protein of unknown function (DUF1592)/Protein of unknown function (DUF1588)/PA14 domain/Cytochrome C oxidase, cbb3-type, subunit III/Protein of unknown function (DUF1585)
MQTKQLPSFGRSGCRIATVFLWGALVLVPRWAMAGEALTGEQIYQQKCASCHGAAGEGTEESYPKPLAGDRSVVGLAKFIAKTMPEDAPGECVGDDAERVSSYIYDAFYSKAAQARNKPPRIELSRLTVRQYRHTVADLIGSFRTPGVWNDQRGLKGDYSKRRGRGGASAGLKRLDPEINFDFGVSSPDPEKFEAHQFNIRWDGSVLAPETGDYEFIIHTEHAVSLWVNDMTRPLIDASVKSGDDTEYRASIYLLGGRVYPLRVDFVKGKQGVDDSKTRKTAPPLVKASISLEWKLPNLPAEVITQRNLTPNKFPETFVVQTPFPPDDRSIGYERGTSISKAWESATTDAAIEVVDYVGSHLKELSGVPDDAANREARLREFCRRFTERAFRRPLTVEQERLFVDRQFKDARDPDTAVKRVVLLVLKSPRFLYREVAGGADAYDVASRLSFGLWDSLPDQELLEAAASGLLATREQVARQAERMLPDVRTHSKLRDFLLQWLKVDQVPEVVKDPQAFPGFNETLAADLRTSLELFLDDVVWNDNADFRQLLLADYVYLNGRLAEFYGVDLPADAPFQKVCLDSSERAGVLSHPYLMASFAYTTTSSPIHRGVYISRSILGRVLRPPPEAQTPLSPDLHAGLTTRERVLLQTSPQMCQTCHGMINPLGFALERFDAVGRYRSEEKAKPIDATGSYQRRSGDPVKFTGARGLATFLANSEETHTALVEKLFQFLVKQPIRAYGSQELPDLVEWFSENDFNIRELMVEVMTVTALRPREVSP